jgi:hypothetical protein
MDCETLMRNITLTGGVAPARAYIERLLPDVLDGTIQPGKVFDRTIGRSEVPVGYRAMANRRAQDPYQPGRRRPAPAGRGRRPPRLPARAVIAVDTTPIVRAVNGTVRGAGPQYQRPVSPARRRSPREPQQR